MRHPADLATFSPQTGITRTWLGIGQSWFGPTQVPLIILKGSQAGPRVVTIAAQHGDEGYAVLGLLRLAEELDTSTLRGEVWVLPCLNVYGYIHGARVSPFDHQDMNRVHPGNTEGTVTEQISAALLTHILPGADLLIDLHGGSPENGDVAFARWTDVEGKPSLESLVKSLPVNFVLAAGTRDIPGMLSSATREIGVPQIAIEACNVYGRASDNAAEMAGFVTTALRYLEMIPGVLPQPQDLPSRSTASHRAFTGGIFESKVTYGQAVKKGELLGIVRTLLGEHVQTVKAVAAGTVAVMRSGTRVHPGESLVTLAVEEAT